MSFPAIVPSARSFSPGQLPIRSYRTLSGAIWKRSFSNTRSGHALSLEFQNITDDEVNQIVKHYESMGGSFYRFPIPAAVLAGMSGTLQAWLASPANTQWAYASEPKVTSNFPGRSSVQVELVSEIAYP